MSDYIKRWFLHNSQIKSDVRIALALTWVLSALVLAMIFIPEVVAFLILSVCAGVAAWALLP